MGFIWHVKCCSGVLWEYVNTNSSFTATKGCTLLHSMVKRYRAEDGDLENEKDTFGESQRLPVACAAVVGVAQTFASDDGLHDVFAMAGAQRREAAAPPVMPRGARPAEPAQVERDYLPPVDALAVLADVELLAS